MRKIYFGAFIGRSIISKFIEFWTRSDYSHIAYFNIEEKFMVEVWSPPSKSPFRILNQYWQLINWKEDLTEALEQNHSKDTIIEIWSFEVNEILYNYINNFMKQLAINKTKYDYLAILSFILRLKKQETKKYFCSEGCITPIVKSFNWYKINPAFVSPGDFVRILQAAGAKNEEIIILNDKGVKKNGK
jgi:hypothetical protein